MKALIASTLSLIILIGCWGIFYHYSEESLTEIAAGFEETVMPCIEEADWENASQNFRKINSRWNEYQKTALYFLDTKEIRDADSAFAKTLMYINAKDVSNSSGELLSLKGQIEFLLKAEGICLRNIL